VDFPTGYLDTLKKRNKTQYMGYATRAYHHTVVVLKQKLAMPLIDKYLFHLRRAKGQVNRPSPDKDAVLVDQILKLRSNRYIGISREGTVSLSWPNTKSTDDLNLTWPKTFQGIYLLISIHVHGEKAILEELSNLISTAGDQLEVVCSKATLCDIAKERKKLVSLMVLMTRFTLQMSSDDCGGLSEYVEFFTAQRKVFSINSQRHEITQEVRDVYNLVESTFYEEQRKIQTLDRIESEKSRKRKSRFETFVTFATSFTLPILLVSGVFGMNNQDLPSVSWWIIMTVSSCLSIILIIGYIGWTVRNSYENREMRTYLSLKRGEIEMVMMEDLVDDISKSV